MLLMVSGVVDEKLVIVTVFPALAVPTTCGWKFRVVVDAGEQLRVDNNNGGCVWVKSKLSSTSLAPASLAVSGARPNRSSIVFRMDENSYTVWLMYPPFANG